MIEITETTYRIRCEHCGTEAILVLGKYCPIKDPAKHWLQTGWLIDLDGGTYCCRGCREKEIGGC